MISRVTLLALFLLMGLFHLTPLKLRELFDFDYWYFSVQKISFVIGCYWLMKYFLTKKQILLSSFSGALSVYWFMYLTPHLLGDLIPVLKDLCYHISSLAMVFIMSFILLLLALKKRFKMPKGDDYDPNKLQLVVYPPKNILQMIGALLSLNPFGSYFLTQGGHKYAFGRNKPYAQITKHLHVNDYVYFTIFNRDLKQAIDDLKEVKYNVLFRNCNVFKKWSQVRF